MKKDFKAVLKSVLENMPLDEKEKEKSKVVKRLQNEVMGATNRRKNPLADETVWNTLISMGYWGKEAELYRILTSDRKPIPNCKIIVEAQPKSPRKGSDYDITEHKEGNSHIDIVIGNVIRRTNYKGEDQKNGITYEATPGGGVCFVESKLNSDISYRTNASPLRNQLIRVIENLLTFQTSSLDLTPRYPQRLHFVMMTPKMFKDNPTSRLYGFLLEKYSSDGNTKAIYEAISKSTKSTVRDEENWRYPSKEEMLERISRLRIHWVSTEKVINYIPNTEYKEALISLVNLTSEVKSLIKL